MTQTLDCGLQVALALAVFVALTYYSFLRPMRADRRLPPGPRPFPILGNIPQMTMDFPEKRFAQWKEKYGDIIFVKMLSTPVLIVNSIGAARELLDKRSAKYSERPCSILMEEMLGWEHDMGILPYNEELRKHRRWMHLPFFSKASIAVFSEVQRDEAAVLLMGLLRDPEGFESHVHRYSTSSLLRYLYGHTATSLDDEYLHIMGRALRETMSSAAPGSAPVDLLPILKHLPSWLPGAGFKRKATGVKKTVQEAARRTYELAASKISDDLRQYAVLPELILGYKKQGLLETERPEIMMFGLTLYAAASDTTRSVVTAFILAMVLHPDVHVKAQEELDHVIGNDRLPTLEDRDALPYLECVLKEIYRFYCPAPVGLPHATADDDEYHRFWIPKGSIVIANIWSMLHDPEIYPDPESFRPERFDGLHGCEEDPRNVVFGFGRRICPGRRFGDIGVWQALANITATFDIRKARDAMGNEITPPGTFLSGIVNHPEKFLCSIKPRSDRAAELILNARAT